MGEIRSSRGRKLVEVSRTRDESPLKASRGRRGRGPPSSLNRRPTFKPRRPAVAVAEDDDDDDEDVDLETLTKRDKEAEEASKPPPEPEVVEEEQFDSEEYDTDLEPFERDASEEDADFGEATYTAACEALRITPASRILEHLSSRVLELKYRSLGPRGAKALAAALNLNSKVERLDLEENGLDGTGAEYIAELLKDNQFITEVNLAKNSFGTVGANAIGEMLKINNTVCTLNLSENKFEDRDAENISSGIEKNERVINLDLSHNSFAEEGAVHLGRAIGSNNSIEILDLSWNNIRRKGAVTLCNGLKRNYCITHVNLSWNGLALEGALAVGEMLRGNKYLRELDVANNRISWEGALLVAKGLKENDTLESLQIGYNPLAMTGCLDILEAVDNPMSVITFIGFEGIPVNRKVVYTMEVIQKNRNFKMTHGGLLDSEDIFGRRMVLRCDPLKLLIQYLSDKGIRPVDLFRTFDKDNQHRVSREQFIQGLKKAKVPLDDYELERVLNRLDSAKEGKISYQRLMRGVKEQIKVNRAEEKRKMQEEQRMTDDHQRIMNLPSITENKHSSGQDPWIGLPPSPTSTSHHRPSSASSISTVLTTLPPSRALSRAPSLKSFDPKLVSSKTSVSSKASSGGGSPTSSRASSRAT